MIRDKLPTAVVIAVIVANLLIIIGCSTTKRLAPLASKINVENRSLVLLKMTTSNEIKVQSIPVIERIYIVNKTTSKIQTITIKSTDVEVDAIGYKRYWISVYLQPGIYNITRIKGGALSDPLDAFGYAPIDYPLQLQFEIKPKTVTYIGNINLAIRPRKPMSNEPPINKGAGIFLGLIRIKSDAPFPNGTFEVSISNDPVDMHIFKLRYPALEDKNITVELLTAE